MRDWHPVVSTHGLDSEDLDAWTERYTNGRRFLIEGEYEEAARSLDAAARLAPAHAATHFHLARALENLGRKGQALEAYRAAKDADQNGWRALSVFNDSLRRLSRQSDSADLIDMERVFEQAAEGVAPGFDLFLDYVHPTKKGNLLIARTILRWILEDGGGGIAPPGSGERYSAAVDGYTDTAYRDDDDLKMLRVRMQMCGMMHQYDAFVGLADIFLLRAESGDPAASDQQIGRGRYAWRWTVQECRDRFAGYLASERRELLGQPFDPDYRDKHKLFYEQMIAGSAPSRPDY